MLRQDSRAWGTMCRTLQRQVQRLLDSYAAFHSRLYILTVQHRVQTWGGAL